MAGSNKQRASLMCPLWDTGVPKGDVWVVTKKAVLPYHIVEMGSGAEGLARLKLENKKVLDSRPQESQYERATKAFNSGTGTLVDQLRSDPVIDIYTSVYDLERQKALFPEEPVLPWYRKVARRFVKTCKAIWDGAQERD